ncbi:MAG: glycerol-3-phosphate 1-O-acyltransferase PlsY [Desulfovibrionaceae bacterium]
MASILLPIAAYLLGSVPFALVIGRLSRGIDIRTQGSGNTGATNVARLCGMPWGLTALALDIAKGALPVLAGRALGLDWRALSVVALAAVLGHVYSVFLRFKGGKAVATSIGAFAALAIWPTLAAVAACVAVIAVTRYVSAGSLTLAVGLPLACWGLGAPQYLPLALALAVLLFWRHRANLGRLLRGEESPLGRRKAAGPEPGAGPGAGPAAPPES